MTRAATEVLDRHILALINTGLAPKEVAALLKKEKIIRNVWRVYDAVRRISKK